MKNTLRWMAHADTIAVAVAEPDGEVRSLGQKSLQPYQAEMYDVSSICTLLSARSGCGSFYIQCRFRARIEPC